MTGATRGGVQMHAPRGQTDRDFLPGGFELRSSAPLAEPNRWVPLSRGECLLLALTLQRIVFAQRGDMVDPAALPREGERGISPEGDSVGEGRCYPANR